MVNLPRFGFPDDSSYGDEAVTTRLSGPDLDALAPRQFVLALPESMVQKLAASEPRFEGAPSAPPPPWSLDVTGVTPTRRLRLAEFRVREAFGRAGVSLLFVLASAVLGGTLAAAGATELAHGVGSTEPVGIAMHTPKTLHKSVRSRDHIAGSSPQLDAAVTISIDSLARSRRRRF